MIFLLTAATCVLAYAQNSQVKLPGEPQKTEAEILRLPQAVADAKTVFIANGGGNDAAFTTFYKDVKQWGRYTIVDSPNQADMAMQFNFAMVQTGENVWTSHNLTNGNIERTTTPIMQPRMTVVIYDPKTKNQLGALMQDCKKNKAKVVTEAVDLLVKKLMDRTPTASTSAR